MPRVENDDRKQKTKLDDIDRGILDAMRFNARISNAALAKIVGLSESATLERVRRLEKTKVIDGYSARIAPMAMGHDVTALVSIRLTSQSHEYIDEFVRAMRASDHVISCFQVMGHSDFIAHVAARDVQSLDRVLTNDILRLKAVERTESMFVLKDIKRRYEPAPETESSS